MNDLRTGSATGPTAGVGAGDGAGSAGQASQVANDHNVHYVPGEHRFEITLNGKPTTISPLEAVCYVLQNRYIAMSDSVAQRTQEMQDQVNEINEAQDWLNAIAKAESGGEWQKPGTASSSLKKWMTDKGITLDDWGSPPDADNPTSGLAGLTSPLDPGKLKEFETQFSNHIDQLSSTNDLKMLSLKTVVNKSQEALTAADGVLQEIKQLMQTINNNIGR